MSWVAVGVGAATVAGSLISSDSASSAANKQAAATKGAITTQNQQADINRAALQPYQSAGTQALARLQTLLGMGNPQTAPSGPTAVLRGNLAFNKDTGDYLGRFGHGDPGGATINDIAPTWNVNSVLDESGNVAWLKPGLDTQTPTVSDTTNSPLLRQFTSADLASDPVYNSGLQFGLDEGTKAIARKAAAGGGYDSGAEDKAITRFANDYGSTKAADSYSRFRDYQDSAYGKLSGVAGMGSGATTVGVNAGSNTASNVANLESAQGNANAAASIARGNAATGAANSLSQYALLSQLSGGGARTTRPDTNALAGDV